MGVLWLRARYSRFFASNLRGDNSRRVKNVMLRVFPKEDRITDIGGRLKDDYLHLRGIVLSINSNQFPIFNLLGFNTPGDLEEVLSILFSPTSRESLLREAYIRRITKAVLEGREEMKNVLSEISIRRISRYQDGEKEEQIVKSLHRSLRFRFNDIYKGYLTKYKPSTTGLSLTPLKICRGALVLTPSGLGIDVEKFIGIYGDFLECEQSTTREHHQEAADAINRFFNGLEITQAELKRYFHLEYGVVRVNPESINTKNYLRLGHRGKLKMERGE